MTESTPICGVCGRKLGRFRVQRGPAMMNTWRHLETAGLVPHVATIGNPGRRATVEEMTAALGDADAARDLWDHLYGREAKPKKIHYHLEEIPAPRVPARPANVDEVPSSAASVCRLALEHGWEVRAVYAVGPLIASDSYAVLREVESVSLRMRRGGQRVVAVWERTWTPDGTPMVTKRTKCPGCKALDCPGCAVGPGSTSTEVEAAWEHDVSFIVTPATAPVKLTDLKAALTSPEAYCERCTEVLGNHIPDPERGYICPKQEATV